MIDWSQIEKYYDQENTAGFAMSLLESEKLLRTVLKEKGVPGKDCDQKLETVADKLSSPHTLEHARNLTKQLTELKLPRSIGKNTTEQVLRTYFTAITEISEFSSSEVGKIKLSYYLVKIRKTVFKSFTYILALSAVAVLISLLITDTSLGRQVFEKIVELSRLIVYRFLPLALGVLIIMVIGVGISLRRKGKKKKRETAET